MPKDYNNMPSIDEAALWERTSAKGLVYLGGTVTIDGHEYRITLFKNENKEDGDNRPAWSFKQNKEIK